MKTVFGCSLLIAMLAGCGMEAAREAGSKAAPDVGMSDPSGLIGMADMTPPAGRVDDRRGPAAAVDGASSFVSVSENLQEDDVAQAEPAVAELPPPDAAAPKPGAKPGPQGAPAGGNAAPARRQIIYTATLHLVVKDFEKSRGEIAALLEQVGGYLAESDVGSRAGTGRTGRWVVRVPVPRYDEFLTLLEGVGVPENVTQKAQDVDQEFIDLSARIANQKRLEDRLVKLLADRAGELNETIEVERKLARVRSEIETMQGRLRYLQHQTSLSTVTVFVREERNSVLPQSPSFGGRIASVWQNSLQAVQQFGEGLVLVTVALTPWLVPAGALVMLTAWLWKRRRREAAIEVVHRP